MIFLPKSKICAFRHLSRTSRNQKEKASRKDAKAQRTRKVLLCGTFAALRLRVKSICLYSRDFTFIAFFDCVLSFNYDFSQCLSGF
ncbi:hypothetical protein DCC62_14615 [candidate division KSB1 bacterium]|nr:MAG: hypothetical protein DCC62_14615 [candidate division KSB1 bacterium]